MIPGKPIEQAITMTWDIKNIALNNNAAIGVIPPWRDHVLGMESKNPPAFLSRGISFQ